MSITRKRFLQAMVVAVATVALSLGVAVPAFALPSSTVSTAYSTYQIEAYSDGTTAADRNLNQHVKITLKSSTNLSVSNADAVYDSIYGETPTCTITIADRNITSSAYYRDSEIYVDPDNAKQLIIDIGPVLTTDENGDLVYDGEGETIPTFTAQYSGVIIMSGYLNGISGCNTNNTLPMPTALATNGTVIPTGFGLNISGEGTNKLTVSVNSTSQVRGMIHLGVYTGATDSDGNMVYTSIDPTAGSINKGTFTIHAHTFATMQPAAYIDAIAALSLGDGYTITEAEDGLSVTITSSNQNDALYMGVYDDDLLQKMGLSFDGMNTGNGELKPDGTPAD